MPSKTETTQPEGRKPSASVRKKLAALALTAASLTAAVGLAQKSSHEPASKAAAPAHAKVPPKTTPTTELSSEPTTTEQTTAPITTKAKLTSPATAKPASAEQSTTIPKTPSESLPGHGQEVSSEHQTKLKESSVIIAKRTKGTEDSWVKFCNANKIDMAGADIQTAAHCFGEGDVRDGYNMQSQYSNNGNGNKAVNMTEYSKFEYALFSADNPTGLSTTATPLARISEISVSVTDNLDLALMRVDKATIQPAYRNMPSLVVGTALPQRGTAAFVYGAPDANGFGYNSAGGTYLGTARLLETEDNLILVGIKGEMTRGENPCAPGASGGAAAVGNAYTGGLWHVNVIGGPPVNDESDQQRRDNRAEIDRELKMDTSEFPTICQYQELKADYTQAVLDGFNDHTPPDKAR